MSKENVKKFYQALTTEEELRTRLNEMFKSYQGQETDEAEKAALIEKLLLPVAAERGLAFTLEELRQYEEEMHKEQAAGELNNDELDAVAGGMGVGLAQCAFIGFGLTCRFGLCWFLGI